jgi:integrase
MSTSSASRAIVAALPAVVTLADVLANIEGDRSCPVRQRQDRASAIRTLAKALGRQPGEIPAQPRQLQRRIEEMSPAMAGLTPLRWRNVLSLTRAALKQADLSRVPGRHTGPLSPAWSDLFRHLNDKALRVRLSRFAHWCSARQVGPASVDDAVMAEFVRTLEDALIEAPRTIHRATCLYWNRAASRCPAWPKQSVAVPSYRETYSLPWPSFPSSLKADVDACLERLSGKDLLAEVDFRPLKESSLKIKEYDLRQFASAVVLRGRDAAGLRSLADLVAVDTVKEGLRFFLVRSGNKATGRIHGLAYTLKAVAEHWVNVPPAHLEALQTICRQLNPGRHGMTDKNRGLLRQFDQARNVGAFINLPQRILADVRRKKASARTQAMMIQIAVAIELLIMVPMRIGNLVALDLDRHLIRTTNRRQSVVYLSIPAAEVKNNADIEGQLPKPTVTLLDAYVRDYRPLLLDSPSPWLFPGRHGRHKARNALADQITRLIAQKTGLRVNPHLFRHIAAKHYLDANPGAYGLVRLIHGHSSVETTTQYYCGTETPAAMKHFDDHILRLREQSIEVVSGLRPRVPR